MPSTIRFHRVLAAPLKCLVFFALACGALSAARCAEPELQHTTIQCTQPTDCWVFEPKSKRIFGGSKTRVFEYNPSTGAQISEFHLRSFVEQMVLNNDKIFVSTSHGLQVIDLETNIVSKLLPGLKNIRSMAVATRTSQYLYTFVSPLDGSHGVDLVVLDSQSLKTLHRMKWEGSIRQPVPMYFAISRDDRMIANLGFLNMREALHKGIVSDILPPNFEIRSAGNFGIAKLPLVQTNFSRQWLAGNELMSADLQTHLQEFPGDCTTFAESRDLFASVAISDKNTNPPDMIVWIGRISDGEDLVQHDIAANSDPFPVRELDRSWPTIEFDEKHEFVFCSYGRGAHVVDIRNLTESSGSSKLMLSMTDQRRYPAGSSIEIDLESTPPGPASKPSMKLASGPAGMELKGNTLTWTPGFDQLGRHELIIAAESGAEKRKFTFALEIVVPECVLEISAQSVAYDPAGRYLAVFGRKAEEEHEYSSLRYVPPTHLQIVDLDSMKVVGTHAVDDWPRSKVFSGNKLFWVPKSVNKRISVGADPDSEVEVLETPPENIEELFGLGERLVVKVIKHEATPEELATMDRFELRGRLENRAVVYDSETWEIIEDHPLSKIALPGHRGAMRDVYSIGDSQTYISGRIVDERDGSIVCYNSRILDPGQQLVRVEERDFIAMINGADGYAWGRRYSSRELKKVGSDETLIYFPSDFSPSSPMHLSRQVPYFLALAPIENGENHQYSMQLFDLVYGKVLGDFPLPAHITFRSGYSRGFSFARIIGNRLVAIVGDRVVAYPMPELKGQLEPLRMLYPKLSPVLVDEPFNCQLSARGGEGPYKFSTVNQVPGIEVDSDSGTLTIDYPQLWKLYLAAVGAGLRYESLALEEFEGRNLVFERQFGIKVPLGRMPISVQCVLEVKDASGQNDQILVSTIAFAPVQPLESEITKGKQVMERRRLQQQQQQRLLPRPGPNAQPPVQL